MIDLFSRDLQPLADHRHDPQVAALIAFIETILQRSIEEVDIWSIEPATEQERALSLYGEVCRFRFSYKQGQQGIRGWLRERDGKWEVSVFGSFRESSPYI